MKDDRVIERAQMPSNVERPRHNAAARMFAEAAWVECQRIATVYEFNLCYVDDETGRTLLLLGADSPDEMTLHLAWHRFEIVRFDATVSTILRWMLERGAHWRGFAYDPTEGRD